MTVKRSPGAIQPAQAATPHAANPTARGTSKPRRADRAGARGATSSRKMSEAKRGGGWRMRGGGTGVGGANSPPERRAAAGIGGAAWRKSIRRRPEAELEYGHEQGQPRESQR